MTSTQVPCIGLLLAGLSLACAGGGDTTTSQPAAICGNATIEPGEECDDGNLSNDDACLSTCVAARCGDGYLWVGVEECDDGNLVDGDGCNANCTVSVCGNGVVEPGEECDDGNTSNDDACLANCTAARCGDGYLWVGVEQCDDGNAVAGDGCTACMLDAP